MAEFVSTTTPTYSDPLRAQSIKALEQRHKEMLAQSAAAGAITPENTQTPVQGFGHLANQLGDSFQRSRVDQAAAAQRQALAQTIAGMDPNNPKPHELATINSADPELAKQMIMQLAEHRRALMQQETTQRGQNMTLQASQESNKSSELNNQRTVDATLSGQSNQAAMETARLEAAKAAAQEKVRTDEISKGQDQTFTAAQAAQKVLDDQAAAREQQKVTTAGQAPELVKMQKALAAGEIDQKTFDAYVKKQTAPSAAETEHTVARQKESVEQQSALGTLDQALGYLDHPDGIFAGKNADLKTSASGRLPEKLTGLSEKTRENTSSYNKIMGGQALSLLTQMKGASSDRDVKINFDIANDPNATVDEKKRAIRVLKEKLTYYVKINNEAITAAGGTAPNLGGGGGAAGGAAKHPEEGRTYSSPGKPTLIRRNGKLEPL